MTDAEYLTYLEEWAADYCHVDLDVDWTVLPAGVQMFKVQALEFIKKQTGIASESLGDYSVSYVTSFPASLLALLRPYRRPLFI